MQIRSCVIQVGIMTDKKHNSNRGVKDITWHEAGVTRFEREKNLGQKGCVIWFTGLSGSGKSTIASALNRALTDAGHLAYQLDGDNIRHGLNSDLSFSPEDRAENIRRVGEVAALFADAGIITLTSFISPYRRDRAGIRSLVGEERFIEIFLDVSLQVCEDRDPKNLYKKARAGEITDFTGIQSPYEKPENPEVRLDTAKSDIDDCTRKIMCYLFDRGFIRG